MLKAARGHFLPLLFLLVLSRDVLAGNDWIKIFNPQLCAVKGSSAPMFCSLLASAGRKINNVFWTVQSKEGEDPQDLAENPLYTGRVHYAWDKTNPSNDCTLNLTDLKQTYSTDYRVWILSDKGKGLSQTVTLSVMDLTVTVPTPVVEGDKVKLGCTQSCLLKEKPKVIWRKDGNSIALKQYENSELILQSVSPKDEGDYSCALQGHEGHPSEPKKLNIMFSPKNTSVSVSPVVITNGTTVTLTCSSDANPPVENYTWFKVNQSTPVESGQQYSISNIRSEDGGQYYCEARNKYGAENSSAVSITVVSITVLGGNSYGMLAVVGATACAAVGVILAVVCVRYQMNRNQRNEQMNRPNSRRRDEQATHDYENDHQGKNNDDIQMNSVYQSLNPNTTQPDAVYQSLNPNTTQPDAVYQTLNPNTTQADAVYQSLNPNTTQADAVYQSLNPNTS